MGNNGHKRILSNICIKYCIVLFSLSLLLAIKLNPLFMILSPVLMMSALAIDIVKNSVYDSEEL